MMSQTEFYPEKTSPSNLIPPELAAMGKQRLDQLTTMQTELLNIFQQANRSWFDRMQKEVRLASEFATKLATARSIPETATVCQEWTSRRMEMAAEDAKRLLADGQNFMQTEARMFSSSSWLSNGRAGSS